MTGETRGQRGRSEPWIGQGPLRNGPIENGGRLEKGLDWKRYSDND